MMMKTFVYEVLKEILASEYPHLESPAVVFAAVTKAQKLDQAFTASGLTIVNDSGIGSYQGHITAPWYQYDLTVVDRFGNQDDGFPPIPGVRSRGQFEAGSFVAIAFAYGDIPVILGEVQL